MTFELWDPATGNRLATFHTPEDAFELIIELAAEDDSPGTLTLGIEDEAGRPHKIASGQSLLAIARESRLQTA
jgi:LysM repeat protein